MTNTTGHNPKETMESTVQQSMDILNNFNPVERGET